MDLVGNWKLVSAVCSTADGVVTSPYGNHPAGFITYTSDGRIWAIIAEGERTPLSGDWASSPASERAEAFAACLAYTGRYTVSGDQVTHHIEAATVENWVHTEQVRFFALQDDRLTLRTPPLPFRGTRQTFEVVWHRLPVKVPAG
jgi:Lipocalin-like domain